MYTKPVVIIDSNLSESIYMGSGGNIAACKSIYMNGIFQKPTYKPIEDGYKKGLGCQGCPAWDGACCRLEKNAAEMNWKDDFRPSWEVAGHKPDEKGW